MKYTFSKEIVFAAKTVVRWVSKNTSVQNQGRQEEAFLVVVRKEADGTCFVQAVKWAGRTAQTNAWATMVAIQASFLETFGGPLPDDYGKEGEWEWGSHGDFCGALHAIERQEVIPGVIDERTGSDLHINCRGNFFFGTATFPLQEVFYNFPWVKIWKGSGLYGWEVVKSRVLKDEGIVSIVEESASSK